MKKSVFCNRPMKSGQIHKTKVLDHKTVSALVQRRCVLYSYITTEFNDHTSRTRCQQFKDLVSVIEEVRSGSCFQ